MNKLLVLLYLSLIVSYSICTECECDPEKNNGENKDDYICLKSGESCNWVLLCEKAAKTDENKETFKCADYAVTVANQETHVCVAAETGSEGETPNPICQEKYLCESVPTTDTEDCGKFIVSEENKLTHSCVALVGGDHKCIEEKYKCKDVPKIEGETEIKCSDFDVDSDKTETHYCKEDTTSETKQCKEEYLCSSVPRPTDETAITCSDYPVSEENKYTHECKASEDATSNNACFESKYKCNEVPTPEEGTTVTCSDFDDENYFCVEGSTTPCTPVKKCAKVDATDLACQSDCSKYKVTDSTKMVCKKHATEEKCEEIYKCEQAPKNAEGECSKF